MNPSNDASFASAKISRPRVTRPFLRQRLFAQLDELRVVPITWIVGAPGAGKTTLVASYLAERQLEGLWLQLDAADADLATFFYYLGIAADRAGTPVGLPFPALMPEYLSALPSFTRRCAEAISARLGGSSVIVLDDCEKIPADAPLHAGVRDLAAALPRGISLLVLSRSEPPPVYARMQLHDELKVLDASALNLTRDEAFGFVAARRSRAQTPADEAYVDRLMLDTGGWFAGFSWLLTDDRGPGLPSFDGKSELLVFDYFATEFFGQFEPETQRALLRTALLPSMTAADAAALCGDGRVGALLDELHRKNCFVVQRGSSPPLYEYHGLFRAFLLTRAAAVIPAEEWRQLQHGAADLLAQAGRVDAAAELFGAAHAWQALALLATREAPRLIASGRHRTLERWLAKLPDDMDGHAPWLVYWRAAARLPFDPVAARGGFEHAYEGFQREADPVGLYSAWSGAMESFFFEWRDFRPADRWIAEFERLRVQHPVFPSRVVELRTYWAMGTLLHRQPQHPLLPDWADRAQALLDPNDRDLSVLLAGYLIIWFLWRGKTAQAHCIVDRITPWVHSDMAPMVLILWSCATALYHSVQGDTDECRRCVEGGLALAERSGLHTFDFLLSAQMARCSLVAGDPSSAETWITRMAGDMRSHSHIDGAFFQHLHSNVAAQRGSWQLALDHARGAMAMAIESGVPFLEAVCHLDLARALLGRGDDVEFAQHIEAARAIAWSMSSPVIEYSCLEAESMAAFKTGDDRVGLDCLTRAMAIDETMEGATYQVVGRQAKVPLYERALIEGVAVEHVQALVRRQRLVPANPAAIADLWPWPVRVFTLGRFEIVCDGEPLRSAGKAQRKPIELLKCICAFGGQAVNQDLVTDALWPDTDGDASDQALRTTLHRLRKLLRHDEAVTLEDRHLSLDAGTLWADSLAFDRAAHDPRMADKVSLTRALAHYRGPFLHGESSSWALAFRHRLRAQFMTMAERLGQLLQHEGNWVGAIDCYVRVIEAEPTAEGFHRQLMAAYAHLGRRAEALAVYRRCRQSLLSEHGVSPAEETQALYRELAAQ